MLYVVYRYTVIQSGESSRLWTTFNEEYMKQSNKITIERQVSFMKKYITYEEPYINQTFTESEMHDIYNHDVDKSEYHDFTDWLHDMIKSGVFKSI